MEANRHALLAFIQSVLPMPVSDAEAIAEQFTGIRFKKNEYYLQEGQYAKTYLILTEGYMRAFTLDVAGKEVTTNFFGPNQVVCEFASYFQKIPSQESIQALGDCVAWQVDYATIQRLFHGLPSFREFGRMILVQNLILLKKRTFSMINQTAEQRYETLLKQSPALFQTASLKYIASYLGITDTSLSRIRKEIKADKPTFR